MKKVFLKSGIALLVACTYCNKPGDQKYLHFSHRALSHSKVMGPMADAVCKEVANEFMNLDGKAKCSDKP
jgi:hypothetical protein